MNNLVIIIGLIALVDAIICYSLLALHFNIDTKSFLLQIDKLITAGNLDRAIKLCRAILGPVTTRGVEAVLTLLNQHQMDLDSGSIRQAYDNAEGPVRKAIQQVMALAAVAAVMALVAIALAFLVTKDDGTLRSWKIMVPFAGIIVAGLAVAKGQAMLKSSLAAGRHMVEKAVQINR